MRTFIPEARLQIAEAPVTRLALILLFGAAFLPGVSSLLGAGISVEQVQRDFQIRHKQVRGNYVPWPKCSTGETPAPAFPKDGFYGDLTEDPDKGVEVVRVLYGTFYITNKIYDEFVKAPNGYGDLENMPSIGVYGLADMPPINHPNSPDPVTDVTSANYVQTLQLLAGYIQKLRLIKVTAEQVVDHENDTRYTMAHFSFDDSTCAQGLASTRTAHALTDWGKARLLAGPIAGALAYWSFDDVLTDVTGNGHTMIAQDAAAVFTPLKINNGIQKSFGGAVTWYKTAQSPDFNFGYDTTRKFTAVGWFSVTDDVNDHSVLMGVDKIWFWLLGGGLGLNTGVNSDFIPTSGVPFFAAFHYDGGADISWLEVNRETRFSTSTSDQIPNGYVSVLDAAWEAGTAKADEVAVFDRLLTDAELDCLYNSGAGRAYGSGCISDLSEHLTGLSEKIMRFSESFRDNDDGRVGFRNTRGKIRADLASFPAGTAAIFLKLEAVASQASLLKSLWGSGASVSSQFTGPGPVASAGTYRRWTAGTLEMGTLATSDYVSYSADSAAAEGECPEFNIDIHGWQVGDQIVVVEPDFTTTPDPQDCCGGCSDQCVPGMLTTSVNSIHVNIDLGPDNYGGSAGSLTLSADLPSPALTTLAALRHAVASSVDVNPAPPTSPVNRLQFKTSQALIDVQVNTAYKYTISTYSGGNFTPTEDGNGFYPPTGPASSTTVIENPDEATAYNKLLVTYTRVGSPSVQMTNVYTEATKQWELTSGDLRKESRASIWHDADTRFETVMIKSLGGQVIYKETNTYELFPWGQERIKQVVDPSSAALTSTWEYYTDPLAVGSYRQLKQATDAKGHWEKYEYDSYGRETKRITQFKDAASSGSESAENLNRVVTTAYSATDPQITIVEKLRDQVIGRRYKVVHADEVREIVRPVAGDAWNDPGVNLVTTTKRLTTGPFKGETQSIEHPDGTMQIFLLPVINAGTRTDTVDSGRPNTGKTAIEDGTRTVTVKGAVGQMISRTVTDIATGITLASETYSNPDPFNRPRRVTYLDGTFRDTEYIECCGISAVTDRDGFRTEYLYDKLNRLVATKRVEVPGGTPLCITETNILDAAGMVRVTKRIGTDNSQTTLRQLFYDLAGRKIKETNALNGVTTFTETANGTVKTTTYPDGGVRTETYHKDGALLKVEGTAAFPVYYEYDRDTDGVFTKETKGTVSGPEWTKSYTDMAGRQYKTVFAKVSAPFPYSQSFYNGKGQLWKQRDPDDVITLSKFNGKGEQEYSIVALTATARGLADYAALESQLSTLLGGNDRITRTVSDVVANVSTLPTPAVPARRTRTWAHADGSSTEVKVSMSETSTDGLRSWQTIYSEASTPVVTQTQTVFGDNDGATAARYRTATVTQPDLSKDVTVHYQGRVDSVKRKASSGSLITRTTYAYNSHGLLSSTTDERNGATTYTYNSADRVERLTSPAPGNGQGTQTTTNFYNKMLQLTNVAQADGARVTNHYTPRGELQAVFGSRIYPVGYSYDSQGRLKTMTNWSGLSGFTGKRITTWNYQAERGWLENKRYPDGATGNPSTIGPDYEYTLAGRLAKRTWARGSPRIETIYAYNLAGELSGISYNDGTPNVVLTYDRRIRQKTVARNSITTTLSYNDANQLTEESYVGGTLNGLAVTPGYDVHLRRDTLSLNTSPALNFSYVYDTVSRLQTVADGPIPATANSATYSYIANSPLAGTIEFKQAGSLRMTTTRQYDKLNRLSSIGSAGTLPTATGLSPLSYSYLYNDANQRVQVRQFDSSQWVYQYDKLGQVVSGKKYWSDGTPVAGQQFEYAFDDIGNRTSTKVGGDSSGTGLRSANYVVNALNQYSQRDVPNALDVIGLVKATTASVTINSSAADYRRGEYFQETLSVANGGQAVWQPVTVDPGEPADVKTGYLFVPKTPELFTPDADGNLLSDGRWTYTWDAENRLTRMVANTLFGPQQRIDFEYDWLGRRIRKKVWNNTTGTDPVALDQKFVYDGWNLIAVLAADNSRLQSFTWGYDLSGTLQRAGGVGGLKAVTVHTGPEAGTYFCAYDGSGNVIGLVSAGNGSIAAQYEYGPFGELIRTTGPLAPINPFRFSTKYQDNETDLLYYGYRFYSASTGRWLSRDPIGVRGGRNVYAFLDNDALGRIDFLGLCKIGDKVYKIGAKALATCEPTVRHWATTPDYEDAIDDFFKLVGTTKNLADIATILLTAGNQGRDGAIEAISQLLADKGIKEVRANDIYELAKKAADEGHGAQNGFKLWTRIRYEQCECGFLGFGSKWKEKKGEWTQFMKRTKHNNGPSGGFIYQTKMLGYADADVACEAHLEKFEKEESEK